VQHHHLQQSVEEFAIGSPAVAVTPAGRAAAGLTNRSGVGVAAASALAAQLNLSSSTTGSSRIKAALAPAQQMVAAFQGAWQQQQQQLSSQGLTSVTAADAVEAPLAAAISASTPPSAAAASRSGVSSTAAASPGGAEELGKMLLGEIFAAAACKEFRDTASTCQMLC
jgi:hypothetical protein